MTCTLQIYYGCFLIYARERNLYFKGNFLIDLGVKMKEKYSYILKIAENDENVRAVVLSGSRANTAAIQDEYQDYDIHYIVGDIDRFDVSVFEDVKLMFIPSDNYPEMFQNEKAYLMMFRDDSRIDMIICTMQTFLSK